MKSKAEIINGITARFGSEVTGVWNNGYRAGWTDRYYDLKSRTELIDELKQIEYQRGCDDQYAKDAASIETLVKEKEEAYDKGVKDGADLAAMHGSDATSKDLEKSFWQGVEEGANKAWETARKLYQFDPSDNTQLCDKLFDSGYNEMICNIGPIQAMEILRAYEQRQKDAKEAEKNKLHVGDVVYDMSDNLCVITQIGTSIHVMYQNGKTHKWGRKVKFRKTGDTILLSDMLDFIRDTPEEQND